MSRTIPQFVGRPKAPVLPAEELLRLLRERWGLDGEVALLDSYIDLNARVRTPDGSAYVLKIANAGEDAELLDLQNRALAHLAERAPGVAPTVLCSRAGAELETVEVEGAPHRARVLTYLEGPLLIGAEAIDADTWRGQGALLARVDRALADFDHPRADRELRWDLARAAWCFARTALFPPERRRVLDRVHAQFAGDVLRRLDALPRGVIHNDAHAHNLVVAGGDGPARVERIFDFGDMLRSARVFELAVAGAYAMLDRDDPVAPLCELARGYDAELPLDDAELEALFPSACMRLALSVAVSTIDAEHEPDNAYIVVSQAPAWRALERLVELEPSAVLRALRGALGREVRPEREDAALRERRARHLGPSLSLSYDAPLEIVRGRGAYLFDADGRAFLDGVNNVCHVGHAHPHVVEALARQAAELNTNTRYLHEHVVAYAERLLATFPAPLEVAFFVNSGSEANELALRLARAATGRRDVVAIEGGYHGHTSSLIDLSPYKHAGPGGAGAPDWVHVVPCPDTYRGRHRADDPDAATKYAAHVGEACAAAASAGRPVAAFFAEPLIGCGGQIVPPAGYLPEAFAHVRAAGGLCVMDEVQVGFGRVGTHMWAFQVDGVVPDVVTLGKPIGNGHPMAAVVTTRAIADAFANGMEFFSTFGGNPVSAAVGAAVLDVIERERLVENARATGAHLVERLGELAKRHPCIGDVRGRGLYLGVQVVADRATRAPDAARLARALESCRETGVLLSSDGPEHDVLKIKPPLAFRRAEADLLVAAFDRALSEG